jgi:hypothetical protein
MKVGGREGGRGMNPSELKETAGISRGRKSEK